MTPRITLKDSAGKFMNRRHPWVFSGAIDTVEGDPGSGDTVAVHAPDGRHVGWGAYSPQSQIRVRMWTFDPGETIDDAFFKRRIDVAVSLRETLGLCEGDGAACRPRGTELSPACGDSGPPSEPDRLGSGGRASPRTDAGASGDGTKSASSACRLVNAESDGLPGLVADRYSDVVVCQFLSAGAERWRETIASVLAARCRVSNVYERSDASGRKKEGLAPRDGVMLGCMPSDSIEISEGPFRFLVDLRHGHKTGFYLDQRQNRRQCTALARDADVLNAFSFTGGFTVAALAGGARTVTEIESSRDALDLAAKNVALNGLDASRVEPIHGNVFEVLRSFRDARRGFDVIVLDPPKFVHSRAQLDSGARGYKDINLLALKLLRPGGWLMTFSCSEAMSPELFQKVVAGAAADAAVGAQIIEWLGAPPDHPVALNFPEGRYLKGLLCRVA